MADEKTEQEVAAETASGDNDTGVTDDMLNQAATDAVVTEPEPDLEPGVEPEPDLEPEPDVTDDNGLPVDHTKRSDLGRKLSAMHRRQDDSDKRLDKILSVLEAQTNITTQETKADPLDGLEPDEPVTVGELDKYMEMRERQNSQKVATYDKEYLNTFGRLTSDLSEDETEAIISELKTMSFKSSADPVHDAETNFYKAERAYLRKQLAHPQDKKNPITGDKNKGSLGTITQQKTVTKEVDLPKLDANAASYLAFVESEDGADKAQELHKSLGKG